MNFARWIVRVEFCAVNCAGWIVRGELSAVNCAWWIVHGELSRVNCVRWVVHGEFCAVNCTAVDCARWIVHGELCAVNCDTVSCTRWIAGELHLTAIFLTSMFNSQDVWPLLRFIATLIFFFVTSSGFSGFVWLTMFYFYQIL
jgi:hypothetical protein